MSPTSGSSPPARHRYRLAGLVLESDRPIDVLEPTGLPRGEDVERDVSVHFCGPVAGDRNESAGPFDREGWQAAASGWRRMVEGPGGFTVDRNPDRGRILVRYPDGVCFALEGAHRVWVSWSSSASFEAARTHLLGPVLGYLLRIRGRLALHASAVVLPGPADEEVAVLIVGPAGSGKSTTAAAFAMLGREVLSDDVAVLHRDPAGEYRVLSDDRYLKLWPEALGLLGREGSLPPLAPRWQKRRLEVPQKECMARERTWGRGSGPRAVLVYLLDPVAAGDGELFRSDDEVSTFAELRVHTFAGEGLVPEERRLEFGALGDLVATVPVRWRTRATDQLGPKELALSIEEDSESVRRASRDSSRGR